MCVIKALTTDPISFTNTLPPNSIDHRQLLAHPRDGNDACQIHSRPSFTTRFSTVQYCSHCLLSVSWQHWPSCMDRQGWCHSLFSVFWSHGFVFAAVLAWYYQYVLKLTSLFDSFRYNWSVVVLMVRFLPAMLQHTWHFIYRSPIFYV